MENKQKLEQYIDLVNSLKLLAQSYEEISVIRMQKIRSQVVGTRGFIENLSKVFFNVKINNKKELMRLLEKERKSHSKKISLIGPKTSDSVVVFVSANSKFYGDLMKKVFHLFNFTIFTQHIKKLDSDIVIVGKLGKELFDQEFINRKYKYFEIPDFGSTLSDLTPIITLLIQYDRVNIFYGKFENVMMQIPTVSSVSGEDPLGRVDTQKEEKITFNFEPSLEEVVHFFETQGFASIFLQAVHESELSRFASRITAMEEAISRIEQEEKQLYFQRHRLQRMDQSKKQIQMLGGLLSVENTGVYKA